MVQFGKTTGGGLAMIFWLGTHQPHWLARTDAPLFVSARRLRGRKSQPRASGPWVLDSGGFTELSMNGAWAVPARQYADEARRWFEDIGNLGWIAPQDWMCEPWIVAKTGLTVATHQRLTVDNYLTLRNLASDLPWVPVLQGWHFDDYLAHVEMYREAGVDLVAAPLVGLGSVCRRQDTAVAEELIRHLAGRGLRLHAFGFKTSGLRRVAPYLTSSDSMSWSRQARWGKPMPGCTHRNCANCVRYALAWRCRLLNVINQSELARQLTLWS